MTDKLKRMIAVFLSAALLISAVPLSASAADTGASKLIRDQVYGKVVYESGTTIMEYRLSTGKVPRVGNKMCKNYHISISGTDAGFVLENATNFYYGIKSFAGGKMESDTIAKPGVKYYSVNYRNERASEDEIKKALESITFISVGSAEITVTAAVGAAPADSKHNDLYYNGHFYRIQKTDNRLTWCDAIDKAYKSENPYAGFKAHPLTLSNRKEYNAVAALINGYAYSLLETKKNFFIWLGAVPKETVLFDTDGANGVDGYSVTNDTLKFVRNGNSFLPGNLEIKMRVKARRFGAVPYTGNEWKWIMCTPEGDNSVGGIWDMDIYSLWVSAAPDSDTDCAGPVALDLEWVRGSGNNDFFRFRTMDDKPYDWWNKKIELDPYAYVVKYSPYDFWTGKWLDSNSCMASESITVSPKNVVKRLQLKLPAIGENMVLDKNSGGLSQFLIGTEDNNHCFINDVIIRPVEGYGFEKVDLSAFNINGLTLALQADGSIRLSGDLINDTDLTGVQWPTPRRNAENLNFKVPQNVTVEGDLVQAVEVGAQMAPVTVTPKQGYEYNTEAVDLLNAVIAPVGLTAVLENNSIRISGAPTEKVTAEIPAPYECTYSVNLGTLPKFTYLTSGELNQHNVGVVTGIKEVVISADDGFDFDDAFMANVASMLAETGLTAVRDIDHIIRIVGAPTKTVDLTAVTWPTPIENGIFLRPGEKKTITTIDGIVADIESLPGNKEDIVIKTSNGVVRVKAGDTVKIDMVTFSAKENTTIKIEKDGYRVIRGAVVLEKGEKIISEATGAEIINTSDENIRITVKPDSSTTPKRDIITIPDGGKVTVNGKEYVNPKNTPAGEDLIIAIDQNGNATISSGDTVIGKGEKITSDATGAEIKNTSAAETAKITVKPDTTAKKDIITIPDGGKATVNGKEYVNPKNTPAGEDLIIAIDQNGNATISSGDTVIGKGEKITSDATGAEIKNTSADEATKITIKPDDNATPKRDIITIPDGGKVTVNDKEYVNPKNTPAGGDLVIIVDQNGNATINSGDTVIGKGEKIISEATGAEIINTSDENIRIIVKPESTANPKKDIIIIPDGGKVTVNGKEYVNPKNTPAGEDLVIAIDQNGNATISSGDTVIGKDEKIISGATGAEIKNTSADEVTKITVKPDTINKKDVIIIPDGGSATIDGVDYKNPKNDPAGGDLVIEVDENKKVTVKDGDIELDKGEKITSDATGAEIENTSADETTKITVKPDTAAKKDIIIIPDGGSATIDGVDYKNPKNDPPGGDLVIEVDENKKVTVKDGDIELDKGEKIASDATGAEIENTSAETTKITVKPDTTAKKDIIIIPDGGSATIDGVDYKNPKNDPPGGDLVIEVDENKKVVIKDGDIELDKGEKIISGATGAEIVNTSDDETAKITVKPDTTAKKDIIIIPDGGSATIDGKEYVNPKNDPPGGDLVIEVDENKKVVIKDGNIELEKGEKIISEATGAEIINTSDENIRIIVKPDSTANPKKDIIIIPDGGKVTVNGKEYVNPKNTPAGGNLVIIVDQNGNATISSGDTVIGKDEKLISGATGAEIKNTSADETTKITVKPDTINKKDVIIIPDGGSATIDGKEYVNPKNDPPGGDLVIELDENKKVVIKDGNIELDKGEKIISGATGAEIVNTSDDETTKITVKPDSTTIPKSDIITIPDGGKVTVNGKEYVNPKNTPAGGDLVIIVDQNGNATISSGGTVIDKGEKIISDATGVEIINTSDDENTQITVKPDNTSNPKKDIIIIPEGGSAIIDGKEYVNPKKDPPGGDLVIEVDENKKVVIKDGNIELDKGEKIISGATGTEIENTSADETTKITVKPDNISNPKKDVIVIPEGGSAIIDGKEYVNPKNDPPGGDLVIEVDENKKVVIKDGDIELDKGEKIISGATGAEIENTSADETTKITVKPDNTANPKKDVIIIPDGGSATIDGVDYKNPKNDPSGGDLIIEVDENKKVIIKDGDIELDKGEKIISGATGAEIKNTSADETTKITVKPDNTANPKKDIIIIPDGGSATIDGVDYKNPKNDPPGGDLVIEVDENKKVTVKDGDIELDKDVTVDINGTDIKNKDPEKTIIVDRDDTTGSGEVIIPAGGSAAIGDGGTVVRPEKDAKLDIDADGKVTIEIPEGSSITIDDATYTGGPTTIVVDGSGDIESIEGDYTVDITDSSLDNPNFKYKLCPGEVITVGNYTYTAPEECKWGDIYFTGDKGRLVVGIKNENGTVKVARKEKPNAAVEYAAGSADTTFTMSKDDNDATMIDLTDNGKNIPGGIRFKDNKPHTVNDVVYTGKAAEKLEYTVTYGKETDGQNNNSLNVVTGSSITVRLDDGKTFTVIGKGTVGGNEVTGGAVIGSRSNGVELVIDNTTGTVRTSVTGKAELRAAASAEGELPRFEAKIPPNYIYVVPESGGGGSVAPDSGESGESSIEEDFDAKDDEIGKLLNVDEHIGYIFGYPDATFRPNAQITRAEATQIFYNLLLNKSPSGALQFNDVRKTDWFEKPVAAMSALGMVSGVGQGKFEPKRSITRAEFVTMAVRFTTIPTGGKNSFKDVPETAWHYKYVTAAVQLGWVSGYSDGTFKPNSYITRAEVVTIVNRMLDRVPDKEFINANVDKLVNFSDVPKTFWAYYIITEAANAHEHAIVNKTEKWKSVK